MANNLYLLFNFNNYYNRKLIRYDTLNGYLNAVASGDYLNVPDVVNFTPNDGISTQQVLNMTTYPLENRHPDYLLVVDNNNTILQRWFVVDGKRTRAGQYIYDLYRDTVAEAWNNIQDAPIFVEKAILKQSDDMIFNSENMSYNQVKRNESLLKDELGCAWVVGYMPTGHLNTQPEDIEIEEDGTEIITFASRSAFEATYGTVGTLAYTKSSPWVFEIYVDGHVGSGSHDTIILQSSGSSITTDTGRVSSSLDVDHADRRDAYLPYLQTFYSGMSSAADTHENIKSSATIDAMVALNTRKVHFTDENQTYIVRVSQEGGRMTVPITNEVSSDTLWQAMYGSAVQANTNMVGDKYLKTYGDTDDPWYAKCGYRGARISLTPYQAAHYSFSIPDTRNTLSDQPYTMFAMPYKSAITISGFNGSEITRDFSNISMMVAKHICKTYNGNANDCLYDLQLLPYCPVRQLISNNKLNITTNMLNKWYTYIDKTVSGTTTHEGIIFWAESSNDTFDITAGNFIIRDYKIYNETTMVRLCSPNFAGQFEFNPAKNRGISKFNVDFTYKPYSPYIHINPDFKANGLYGGDFNDARGLICEGKFDLPQTENAWATYERSNANYNNIFNRQIQHLEFVNSIQHDLDVYSAIGGTAQGTGASAALGSSLSGGSAGWAMGSALAGGIASGFAGYKDVELNDKLRAENLSYTKDMYGYKLGTIKALSDSLTSVGALTNNNKIWPFIEIYTATDAEIEALKNKIRFNGMSVGRIDKLVNFVYNTWEYSNGWNYFKGQLIRAEIPDEDWHFINTLKAELNMGIFIEEAD